MTLIVGILCSDGVVMASDSAATFGAGGRYTIGQQAVQKVVRINDHVLVSSTGAIGISQLICDKIKTCWSGGAFTSAGGPDAAMGMLSREIAQVVLPYLQTGSLQKQITGEASTSLCKAMVAMPVDRKGCLYQFDVNGAPERATPELPFVALGSGQPIADPFLAFLKRLLWTDSQPTVADGRLVGVWTIDHVRRTNPGGWWGYSARDPHRGVGEGHAEGDDGE